MKKLIMLAAAVALGACSGLNKNTISYQMSKYDTAKYYVVSADGETKAQATANALSAMQQDIIQTVPAANTGLVADLIANAKAEKVWKDKESKAKHYYALAVLPRSKARAILEPLLDQADTQLTGLAAQFATPADPLADLKVAYKMQPVIENRLVLDDLYQFLDESRRSYKPENFAPYKNAFKEKMRAVLVGVETEGTESAVLNTYVIDALNKMGLGVVTADNPNKVLLVKIETETDDYTSKKVEGLVWCSSSAAISLIDTLNDATFSRFSVHERAGTSRYDDSLRRSMQHVGETAAPQIAVRLENFLKTR